MYQRILVPIDGSATSESALNEAIKFAQQQKAHIEVLYVVEDLLFSENDDFINYAEFVRSLRTGGEKILLQAQKKLRQAGIEHETKLMVAQGERIVDVIINEAKSNSADLIIIGTHGRTGFSRILLGSVAEGVVRTTHIPTLLIRGG
ncbi:universal stress protein [Nitrosomonas sp.]|uniref:universal stress protein n=1 Tax=Nitrosomonas sp. TaxID=42353 RepID=UPI001DA3B997|nr:universal stress protein [Nitrosomonas sp.]MBX3616039.1 universal stress protein [Nitrosomonas sp.]